MINNEIILKNIKKLDLSNQKFICTKIGEGDKKNISEFKYYSNKVYLEYCDGKNEYLILSNKNIYIYNYFLKFNIIDTKLKDDKLIISYEFFEKNIIENIEIILGEEKYKVKTEKNKIIFNLKAIDYKNENFLFEKVFKLSIIFINENIKASKVVILNIPMFFDDVLLEGKLIHKSKNNNILINSIYNGKEKKIIDYFKNNKDKKFEIIGLEDNNEIYNEYVYTYNHKGYKYIVEKSTEKEKILSKIKKKKKRKILKYIIYKIYLLLGNDRYNKLKFFKENLFNRTPYRYYLNNLNNFKIKNNVYLIEGAHGNELGGNSLALAKEISIQNKVYISVKDIKSAKLKLKKYNIKANLVKMNSKKYYNLLLSSEYILLDSTLPRYFIKQKNQKVYNSWHGTPLKSMGKKIKGNPLGISNVQKNFIFTDKIMVPNELTLNVLNNDFGINIFFEKNQKFKLSPSPRNSWLFNENLKRNKVTILWMPTWRGEKDLELFYRMDSIFSRLGDEYDIYVKAHQFAVNKITDKNFSFKYVEKDLDIYDFMNSVDILITDYSSVMFDFAIKNKKIILDWHDYDEYFFNRGIEFDINKIPFNITYNEKDLIDSIKCKNEKIDYEYINKEYNSLDNIDGAKNYFDILKENKESIPIKCNKKKVLIYPGGLLPNGITTAFKNLINNLKLNNEEYKYILFLPQSMINNNRVQNIIEILDLNIDYIASPAGIILQDKERFYYEKFVKKLNLNSKENQIINNIFKREAKRLFNDIEFDHLIHFTGYDSYVAKLFLNMKGKKHIFVHSDMKEEILLRNNFNEQVILEFYQKSTTINVVTESIKESLSKSYFDNELIKKVNVVHNTINFDNILKKSQIKEDYFDEKLEFLLNNDSIKFINVSRFSPEKGLDRLIIAFNNVCKKFPEKDLELFIIGGHGQHESMIKGLVDNSDFNNKIHLYTNINPLPILKKADLFILSSYYEGLPMVFFESLVLGVPILSTDITGPRRFLNKGYGNVCGNSIEGITEGMIRFLNNELNTEIKSLKEFNEKAIKEFNNILKK